MVLIGRLFLSSSFLQPGAVTAPSRAPSLGSMRPQEGCRTSNRSFAAVVGGLVCPRNTRAPTHVACMGTTPPQQPGHHCYAFAVSAARVEVHHRSRPCSAHSSSEER